MQVIASSNGGIFLYLILLCSAVIAALVAHRIYLLYIKNNVRKQELVKEILICIEARELDGAMELCDRSEAALCRILGAGLHAFNNNFNHNEQLAMRNTPSEITFSVSPDIVRKEEVIRRAMDEKSLGLLPALGRGLRLLPMLSKVAVLLGVAGTIYGVMNVLASSSAEAGGILAGISGSLGTTLAGVLVAIPTAILHSFFQQKKEQLIEDTREASRILLNALLERP